MARKIHIFDTTLRDGEQSPGASMNSKEKMDIARQLARLGVDIIEAGFPIASPGDFESVSQIAKEIDGPVICGLSRVVLKDIDQCWKAVQHSKKPRIHTFVGTSDIQVQSVLRKTRPEVLKMAASAVRHAKSMCQDVEFSPMDAVRTEKSYLYEVISAAIEEGATVVNIPDTVGYSTPAEFGELISDIRQNVPNIDKVIISVHCHDDLGMAVANSLAGVEAGASQIECAINGLGERAGNTSLEEVVMAIKTRGDYFGAEIQVNTQEILRTSQMVSTITGFPVPPNKAIVGANAFAHSSGIHQDGVLKERSTFEIMSPEMVGRKTSDIVLSARSGRHAIKFRLSQLGYEVEGEELDRIYERFLVIADKKKEVFDEDLIAIMEDEAAEVPATYKLDYIHVTTGSHTLPTATIKLAKGKDVTQDAACGDGPVDAAYKTIDRITGVKTKLVEYKLNAVTGGKDAIGEVVVRVESDGQVVRGRGSSTDIIEASARAYVNALNRLLYRRDKNGSGEGGKVAV
jgi:2-isopropylmalate synthase